MDTSCSIGGKGEYHNIQYKTWLIFPHFTLFCQELRKYKENEKDTEVLMSALSAMQDKTQHLENSLSAETRIKLDLFSALGDAKRQLEIAQGIHIPHPSPTPHPVTESGSFDILSHVTAFLMLVFNAGQIFQKEQEIKELKQKIAEVMAVMPSISYSSDSNSMPPISPHYSSKFMDTSPSSLDPNASVYQPLKKWPALPPSSSELTGISIFFSSWPLSNVMWWCLNCRRKKERILD